MNAWKLLGTEGINPTFGTKSKSSSYLAPISDHDYMSITLCSKCYNRRTMNTKHDQLKVWWSWGWDRQDACQMIQTTKIF